MGVRFFFEEEEQRGVLHIIAFMLGILIYFSFKEEPNLTLTTLVFSFSSLLFVFSYIKKKALFVVSILQMGLFGFFISNIHTYFTDTIFLPKKIEHVVVQGEVDSVRNKITTAELILKNPVIEGLSPKETPFKIKMWVPFRGIRDSSINAPLNECYKDDELIEIAAKRGTLDSVKRVSTDTCIYKRPDGGEIKKGDIVSGFVYNLSKPMGSQVLNGYNQRRNLFFDNVGGVGSFSELYVKKHQEEKQHALYKIKKSIQEKISFLNKDTKGIVNALLLGDQSLISKPIEFLYRALGLTHILSVSGFHIGLITFFVYKLIRFLLTFIFLKTSLSPIFIRQISALGGLGVSFCYVLLSGAEPPAVRSFVMVLFLFACFFFYRSTISIRVIFITAFLLLLYKPVLLLSPGFQLSFIAVLSLCVLVKEFWGKLKPFILPHKFLAFLIALLLLNCVVTITTMPFVGYHFHKVALYGIIGNLFLSFFFSLFVMPLLVLSVALMPFGLEKWSLVLIDWILTQIHLIGEKITSFPFYMIPVPVFDTWGLICFSFGIMILCALQKKARMIGLFLICISPFSFLTIQKPDIIVAKEGRLIAVRENDTLKLNETYRHRYVSDILLLQEGILPENYMSNQKYMPSVVNVKGSKIAFDLKNCKTAEITFLPKKLKDSDCLNVYFKEDLEKIGPVYLFVNEKGINLKKLGEIDKNRPWGR